MKYFYSFIIRGKSIGKLLLAPLMSLLLLSCAPYNKMKDDDIYLPLKSEFVSFEIEYTENQCPEILNTEINLIIRNLTSESIIIEKPSCWRVNITSILRDSDGNLPQLLFISRTYCDPDFRTLEEKEKYEVVFKYRIEELFRLESGKIYELNFLYRGNIYNWVKRR
jgi:hypothetical protein